MAYGTVNADVIQSSVAGVSLGAGNATNFKNRVINGDMRIDQRNGGATVTITGNPQYTLDRWAAIMISASKVSIGQNAGGVTPPAGFSKYLGITSLAATSVGSTDYYYIQQKIEGLNTTDLNWGTANAKTVTLSAWVYSSLTGTFGGSLRNDAQNRSYPFTYTISAANTWTQISVTIAGDTSGTWTTTTAGGIDVIFSQGMGSTFQGTAGAWAAANYGSATGTVNVVSTNGATFYITGIQFEVGSSATGFDFRNYGVELLMCQRYFQYLGGSSSTQIIATTWAFGPNNCLAACLFPVPMRTIPTLSYSAVGDWCVFNGGAGGPYACNTIIINRGSNTSMSLEFTASNLTAGQAGSALANSTTNARLYFSAEL